jgi:anti-sigma B factor antagonist
MWEIVMEPTEGKIFVEHSPEATTVTFMDEKLLDAQDIQELQEALMSVVEQARREKLILDFCNVQFLSSAVLGLIVKVHKNICKRKGQLQLRNINTRIYEIFKITKLTEIFDIS